MNLVPLSIDSIHFGQPLPFVDGQIAAIAMAHGLTLITRNTRDFAAIKGLRLANWFTAAAS